VMKKGTHMDHGYGLLTQPEEEQGEKGGVEAEGEKGGVRLQGGSARKRQEEPPIQMFLSDGAPGRRKTKRTAG
jgi:hypothetical protein